MSTFVNSFMTNFHESNQAPCFGISIPEKQFVRSQKQQKRFSLGAKNKINIKQFQLQQKVIYLKIQLQLQTIFYIMEPKVVNTYKNVFNIIKSVRTKQQINFVQQKIAFQYTSKIFNKIKKFAYDYQTKMIADGFNVILTKASLKNNDQNILPNKKKPSDKRYSETLRINSKIQDSLRRSDLGIDQQYSNLSLINPKKKNKQLKKQKQHFQKHVQNFYLDMNRLLDHHEQNFKKK